MTHPTTQPEQEDWETEAKKQAEKILHIDWAFSHSTGKPDKVIVQGYPSGAYHLSYNDFIDNIVKAIATERTRLLSEVRELVEGMKSEQEVDNGHECYDPLCDYCEISIKNNCLDELLSALTQLERNA